MAGSRGLASAIAVALIGSAALAAQNTFPAQDQGSTVAQVKAMHADLSRAIEANTRAQLVIGRLASQDARVAALTAQVVDAQRAVMEATSARIDTETEIRKLTAILPATQPQPRAATVQEVNEQRQVLVNRERQEQLAQTRLVALQRSLDAEQAKRTELVTRLDDLDRSLSQRREP